jgi:2-polyprenyl-3-methyl-5-hydroxy-6-metoxy-1,4-benzoquinol methylase
MEKIACEMILSAIAFDSVVELGGGTGKNTSWLAERAKRVLSVDQSEDMQNIARQKVAHDNVSFRLSDINKPWDFVSGNVDLITSSLVLEHVEGLDFVFQQASQHLGPGAHFYICELHPFKQYTGSKARFDTGGSVAVLECFTHNVSDFLRSARDNNFDLADLSEWFDHNDRTTVPRLISFLFRRK